MVIVRFAPSPTGIPHVGSLRTTLYNFFFARRENGKFILRIEDTDQSRKVEGAKEAIIESLKWLGINWDEMFIQSERLSEYEKYAQKLVSDGLARKDEGAIRFLVPKEGETSWVDLIGKKKISFRNQDVEDFIILKKDGYPTYHLANVVDDHMMGITHVIRGDDWVSSAPKHLLLYKAFGWSPPVFAHLPNVLGTDGKKLSKRKGAKSALDYKNEGILPEALLNYLMLLGWTPKNNREILTSVEIEKEFNLDEVHVSPAVFDERKLYWMNGEYIRQYKIDDLKLKISEFDPSVSALAHFDKYVELAQTRMKTLADFKELVENAQVNLSQTQIDLKKVLADKLSKINWNKEEILKTLFEARDKIGAKTQDLYVVLTGKTQGLPIAEKLEIEGKKDTLKRLE